MLGTRDSGQLEEFAKSNPKAKVGSSCDAASFGETIVLAVKGSAAEKVLGAAGAANLAGKTIIDANNPRFKGGKPTMFIAGNNAAAKATVATILDQFSWEVEDMGGAEAARAIEPLCMLWCIPGFARNDRSHAFKMLC
jgi:hypothetical protein